MYNLIFQATRRKLLLLLFVAAQFPLLYEYTFVFGRGGGALCRVFAASP